MNAAELHRLLGKSMVKPSHPFSASERSLDRNTRLVGKGFTSNVYEWGERRVLKLFHEWVPACRVEREHRITQAIFAAGLPAPATYELLRVEDRLGIVFERVEGVSMLNVVQAKPWTLFTAVKQLADLHHQIHRCAGPGELPSQREWIAGGIDRSTVLSASEKQAAQRALSDLPDGTAICHGDFHPDNVLFSTRGPIVIDWETATRGNPLGDVACTSRLMKGASLPPMESCLHALAIEVFTVVVASLLFEAIVRTAARDATGTAEVGRAAGCGGDQLAGSADLIIFGSLFSERSGDWGAGRGARASSGWREGEELTRGQ
jgi:uncharacterized protein (TIGR02172 family)